MCVEEAKDYVFQLGSCEIEGGQVNEIRELFKFPIILYECGWN